MIIEKKTKLIKINVNYDNDVQLTSFGNTKKIMSSSFIAIAYYMHAYQWCRIQ